MLTTVLLPEQGGENSAPKRKDRAFDLHNPLGSSGHNQIESERIIKKNRPPRR
jgi:hypothetical protein